MATSSLVLMFVPKALVLAGIKLHCTMVDVSEGSAAEFARQSVLSSYSEFHFLSIVMWYQQRVAVRLCLVVN
jgi:hypothetical protein